MVMKMGKKNFVKKMLSIAVCFAIMAVVLLSGITAEAKGTTFTQMNDVYYTVAGCSVYAEPTYTSTVLTVLEANIPVRVIGSYSNGWYRINIGVIAYCKMDSLTSAGDLGLAATDKQAAAAKQTADEMGYAFHYLSLNKEKTIKKDIFNSYIGEKAILFVKIDKELAVSFKMLYADPVKEDICLDFSKTNKENPDGSRTVTYIPSADSVLYGQLAIFQFLVGYDKAVDMYICDMSDYSYNMMNTYYTEFSEFAYAPVTQISNMQIVECEVTNSLNDTLRAKMNNIRQGIKYLSYDKSDYRDSIGNRLRKDTEYVDYEY